MLDFSNWLLVLVVALVLCVYQLYPQFYRWKRSIEKAPIDQYENKLPQSELKTDIFEIIPLPDFDWRTTEPLKFRQFKDKYHLTMGLTNTSFSEFVQMDKTYLDRIELRKQAINDHLDITIQASSTVIPALNEIYTWLTNTYLPTRFPKDFTISTSAPVLSNHATKQHISLTPPSDPIKAFQVLGENIDLDILLLLPSEDGDGYRMQGYVVCFPSGFNTKEKFGLKLRDIHGPVPGYKEKLEKSMDRFFDKLEVGKIVLRSNWSIQTHANLYAAGENHLYKDDPDPVEDEAIDVDKTFLRCERQTLHRLPETKALVFAFKTYIYPIAEIKQEPGMGDALAAAIDGLKSGSVPAMHFYKKGVVWGEAVKQYLRS